MSEFIDREKAIAKIKAAYCCGCNDYGGVKCRACQLMDAMDVLEDEPAVAPDVQRWCNPETDLPKVETEVLVLYRRNDYWALQRRTTRTAMFSPRTANGIGKISLIGEHTTRNRMTTESRKDGGNIGTSTRTMFTTTR